MNRILGVVGDRRVIRAGVITVVLLVYLHVSLLHGRSLASTAKPSGFHATLAEAFLKGNIEVAAAPPGLLALSDPYDPAQNAPFRVEGWHDYALYGSNLYVQQGPTPAVLLHIPYRILGFGYLNPLLATLLCISMGFLALCGATRVGVNRWGRRERRWVEPLLLLGLGLATPLPWILSVGRAYEESIVCGFAAVAVCMWSLARASVAGKLAWVWCGVASIAVGVAFGSRPHLGVVGALLLVASVIVIRRRASDSHWLGQLVALLGPAAAISYMLLLYNVSRFGSPFDFGLNFVLAGTNQTTYPVGEISYLKLNVQDFVFSLPRFRSHSPHVFLMQWALSDNPAVHGNEPVAGMFTLFPWIAVGLLSAAASARTWLKRQRDLLVIALTIGFIAIFTLVSVSTSFNASTMRYSIDFIPWFAVVAGLGLLWATCSASMSRIWLAFLSAAWVVALSWSIYCGIAIATANCRLTGSC